MRRPLRLVVPGPIDQRTGGYLYDRRIVLGLRAAGWSIGVDELAGRFPLVDDEARASARTALESWPAGALPIVDGLALPAFADLAVRLPVPWVGLVHHPLALETGLEPATATALARLERRLLLGAAWVIVTSPRTRRDLAAMGIAPAGVAVVPPGTDPAPLARGSGSGSPRLLCVASLTARKGHLVLLEALARLAALEWRLTCVGSAKRDPTTARAVRSAIRRLGLERRVELAGDCSADELQSCYERSDLFVLASHHEGFGMVLAEALAWGLPIVATTAGAIPDTVPADAGLLAPPGDPVALAAAIRRVLTEPSLRAALAAGARRARSDLSSWANAVRAFADELEQVG